MNELVRQLIVRQRPAPHPELAELVATLQASFGLDAYTSRQQLLGCGLVQLTQGVPAQLEAMSALLRQHGYRCWLVTTGSPGFTPPRLRSLAVAAGAVEFHCEGERLVRLERGQRAVGILADVSGELAGRQVRRLLAQNAYLGQGRATVFTPEELRQAILKGQPVFDCYLLDGAGQVHAAFRAFAGRFSPEGLGSRAGLSAVRNLEALAGLVGDYAGEFQMYTDFGLSPLPGCLPQPTATDPAALLGNLEALTRYGWLVAGLDRPGSAIAAETAILPVDLGEAISALAADDGPALTPGGKTTPTPLPPPPERPAPPFSLRRYLPVLASVAGGTLLAVAGRSELLRPVLGPAVSSGLLPGVAAVALCWGAFACLRVKRFIEDTPTSRIRSLAMGLVEVQGRAIRRYALVAPMTQSACVWYRLRKYRRDSRDNWRLDTESDSGHVPFVLDDGSGQVVIDPAGATILAETRQTGYPGTSALIGASVDGGPDEKWVEELIYEGTTLYVLGYARPARAVGPGLQRRTVEVLRRLKLDPRTLHRYDSNGDGRLDADEWQTARSDAETLAAAEQLAEAPRPGAHVLLGRPPRGLPFLIAERASGDGLAGRYGWFGAVLLVLGLGALTLTLKLSLDFFSLP